MSNKSEQVDIDKYEAKFRSELDVIKKEIDDLYSTVYKGNGSPSLVTRMSSVEGKLRGLREQMDEKIAHLSAENALKFDSVHQKLESKFGRLEGWMETKINSLHDVIKSSTQQSVEERRGQWQVKVALITAVGALVATLIRFFVS